MSYHVTPSVRFVERTVIRFGIEKRDVPVLHTGLISCSTGTSIPPKVENPGSTSVDGSRIEPTTFQSPPYVCYGKARALPTELPPPVRAGSELKELLSLPKQLVTKFLSFLRIPYY
jgi:hypothetical protein